MSTPIQSADDFIKGQKDCQDGVPHKRNMSRDYDRGYDIEYMRQETLTQLSLQRGHK